MIDLKLSQCVEAYQAIVAISQKEMDYQSALAMVDMMNRLKPQVDFYSGKELDLVNSYAKKKDGKIVMGETGFIFQDPKKAKEYELKHKELDDVEISMGDPVKVKAIPITPAQLKALNGFVEFEVV